MDINGCGRYMSTCILLQYYTKMVSKQKYDFSEQSLGNEQIPDPCKSSQYKFIYPLYYSMHKWLVQIQSKLLLNI